MRWWIANRRSFACGAAAGILWGFLTGAAACFKGAWNTPAGLVSIALGLVLPLYTGVATFMVWVLRLPSVRAPDWETHYPKRFAGGGWRSWLAPFTRRRKGGDSAIDK